MAQRYACPCCGYLTLQSQPPGSFELCPVCDWEDDSVQFADPDYEGGANRESLNVARETSEAWEHPRRTPSPKCDHLVRRRSRRATDRTRSRTRGPHVAPRRIAEVVHV